MKSSFDSVNSISASSCSGTRMIRAYDTEPAGCQESHASFIARCLPHADLELDRPDESWVCLDADKTVAGHFSLWFSETPVSGRKSIGYIGHYYAKDSEVGRNILQSAARLLKSYHCDLAVGPVDGNTWRRYRLICGTTGTPKFLLEPDNPMDYPGHFLDAGFEVLATYSSSMLEVKPEFLDSNACLPTGFGPLSEVTLRSFDSNSFEKELRDMYGIACDAFAENFLYSEIDQFEFLNRYRKLRPLILTTPELVLIAEYRNRPIGFVLAVPDPSNSNCMVRTAVVKTVARVNDDRFKGLGRILMAECHARADRLGFTHLIHALYKDDNASSAYSTIHDAEVFRRYAVYARSLV